MEDDFSSPYGPNPFTAKNFDDCPTTNNGRGRSPGLVSSFQTADANETLPWERKASEIEQRTRELERRESQLRSNQISSQMNATTLKNFPPFYPLVYHDIEAELPGNLTAGAYILNLLASIMMLFSGVTGYNSLSGVIFAAIYAVLFPAVAFFGWHLSLYKALKFDSSFWFIAYFVAFGIQMLFYAFLAVGLFNGGGGGILGMLEMLSHGKIIATILSALCTAAMAGCLLLSLALIKRVNDHFRSGGHSMERAGAEAGRGIAHNETVRRSAKEAAFGNSNNNNNV